jgi:hypothetical protein
MALGSRPPDSVCIWRRIPAALRPLGAEAPMFIFLNLCKFILNLLSLPIKASSELVSRVKR